ncbi:hypothetical protein ANCCEY_13571 [Ancylostoma ceylanicum]|uniref:L-lactate dehydrogenase n=1 Tax=Ancylostoma ceylanicum TaxID=53326 RepID=A0A0D6LIA6_9BILA|nr:hypothetical protein ANCCEY_13571 [Ancylostoma ceylanicum]
MIADKVQGEMMDLQHGQAFTGRCVIKADTGSPAPYCFTMETLPKRFRFLLSEKLSIAPSSCHGWIIGEHGDSSVPVWSGVNVAGVTLTEVSKAMNSKLSTESWEMDLHRKVVDRYKLTQIFNLGSKKNVG